MAVHNAQLHPDVAELNPELRIAIVASEFNEDIMVKLLDQTLGYLSDQGFTHVDVFHVPGAYEIPALTRQILERGIHKVIITLGCVVRGSTPHFDYICTETSRGLMDLSMSFDVPIVFGVLTCDTQEQAEARVNSNYAIYALNYLLQRETAVYRLDTQRDALMSNAASLLDGMSNE